jgi:hypothetical protein
MSSDDWVVVSAVVQAASAVAIVALTIIIVRFTGKHLGEVQRANALQEQANAISAALVARATKQDTPFLVATGGGGSGRRGGPGDWRLVVQNRGGSLAHDISIETTRGTLNLDSLGQGDEKMLTLHVDADWDTRPEPVSFRFKDPTGVEWVQKPSQLPEEA